MTSKKTVEELSVSDERILQGFKDPVYEEPEQIIPVEVTGEIHLSEEEQNVVDLNGIKDKAVALLKKIDRLKNKIDSRCKDLNINIVETEESDNSLLKAMWRVFKQRSTKITYAHYKKALELRAQLAKEDEERVKLL